MTDRPLKERGLTGLCGPYAIVNALRCLNVLPIPDSKQRTLARDIAGTLPESISSITRDGTDRDQLIAMLRAAEAITHSQGWEPWFWVEGHPRHGQTAAAFWTTVRKELAAGRAAAVVGFGDYHTASAYYEPHWTCTLNVKGNWIRCLDSDVYDRIRASDTGIRPEPGWEIEDCFFLRGRE
jgi:hypothetical protein